MRNNSRSTKQSAAPTNRRIGEARTDRNGAVSLLREALGSRAAVDGQAADLAVRLLDGAEVRMELKSWTGTFPSRSRRGVVWILRRAPRRVHDQLRENGVSFIDLAGAVHLVFPNLLVDRVNVRRPARAGPVQSPFDPFADRSSLVLRTLLDPGVARLDTWGVCELAHAAGVAPATVTRVVRALAPFGVLNAERPGRESRIQLTDPRRLFALWTGAYNFTGNPSLTVRAPVGDPARFLRRLSAMFAGRRWALTVQAGASLVAPHGAWNRIHAYVHTDRGDDLLSLAREQGWETGDDGQLVLMKPYYRHSVWQGMRSVGKLPVVSDLQLALDLWHYPLRGREGAEHLIETRRLFG